VGDIGDTARDVVLETIGLTVRFGGVTALSELDLRVGAGELVGLIGPNGAGKTTAIDAITGFVPSSGRVVVGGIDVSDRPPHTRVTAGIGRTWQSVELFGDLDVFENVLVAAEQHAPTRRARPVVEELVEELGLTDIVHARPGDLSQGHRKLVGVARALAARPAVVCLDEPAAGLDTTESLALGSVLRAIVERGTAILLVDHDMDLVLEVCDRITVLEFGQCIATGPPVEVTADQRVIEAYLGRSVR
jgi:branched-chain amino acid transport system ATP-binding protein